MLCSQARGCGRLCEPTQEAQRSHLPRFRPFLPRMIVFRVSLTITPSQPSSATSSTRPWYITSVHSLRPLPSSPPLRKRHPQRCILREQEPIQRLPRHLGLPRTLISDKCRPLVLPGCGARGGREDLDGLEARVLPKERLEHLAVDLGGERLGEEDRVGRRTGGWLGRAELGGRRGCFVVAVLLVHRVCEAGRLSAPVRARHSTLADSPSSSSSTSSGRPFLAAGSSSSLSSSSSSSSSRSFASSLARFFCSDTSALPALLTVIFLARLASPAVRRPSLIWYTALGPSDAAIVACEVDWPYAIRWGVGWGRASERAEQGRQQKSATRARARGTEDARRQVI